MSTWVPASHPSLNGAEGNGRVNGKSDGMASTVEVRDESQLGAIVCPFRLDITDECLYIGRPFSIVYVFPQLTLIDPCVHRMPMNAGLLPTKH